MLLAVAWTGASPVMLVLPVAVKLQVVHTGFTGDEQGAQDARDVGEGWPAILSALKTLLETDRPPASPGHLAPRTPATPAR